MLEAVLFDWGDTLMRWEWQPELLDAGHAAGLRALGREPLPDMTTRFRSAYLPLLGLPGALEEVEYPGLVRRLLGESGIDASDEELERFLEAEHAAWQPARQLAATTHALLESLRERGLKLGLVSNAIDPPALLHRDLEQLGVASRLDAAVFSSEVGWRKPHPAIFQRALDALGVVAERTLFVGDTLAADVAGAARLGMRTCLALWFRADEEAGAPDPDFRAFTQMDVLTAVARLAEA
ncbi:MAG: hydrolase / 5-amino-6-(5-phospho-D-ribitylamino)uracil phosphatase [Actinomycetota bacterium]